MADAKISTLTVLVISADTDLIPIVDVSDTTMGASGTTKQIQVSDLLAAYVTTADLTATGRAYSAAQYHATTVITFASPTTTWDVQAQPNGELTLTGNTTLDPTNLADGVTGHLLIRQDATGGRVLTFGAAFSGTDGTMPTVDTTANALTVIPYFCEAGAVIVASDPAATGDATSLGGLDVGSAGVLTDPNADRILFWDDSAGTLTFLSIGTNLTITGTTLDASAGAGGYTQVQDEGTNLTQRTTLDFQGAGVSVTDDAANSKTVVTIAGGGGGSAVLAPITWDSRAATAPTTAYPTHDTRNSHPVLDFDDTIEEACYFRGVLAGYAGGTLTVKLIGTAETATTGDVVLGVSWERLNTDLDTDAFATEKTVTVTVDVTSGVPFTASLTFSSAEIDGTLIGEPFRLKVARKAADVADTATGDYELAVVHVSEG